MKFLFVSLVGDGLALAHQLLKEQHEVKFFIYEKKLREIGRGLVPKILNWKRYIDWADTIVFDDVCFGKDIDRLRKRGYAVVGGNAFGDRLENDRFFAYKIMRQVGMSPPWLQRFRNFQLAIRFVRMHPAIYVMKFNGPVARYSSYVGRCQDASDLLGILEHYQEKWPAGRKIDFVLQKYINGIEITVGAFFNGKDFVFPTSIIFEHKRFFNNEIGPNTIQMGTVIFYTRRPSKIFQKTLYKIKPFLADTDYRGFIELNAIVNGRGIFPLEFSSRFGYPIVELKLHKTKWGKFLFELARGELRYFKTYPGFAVGVVLGGGGMPYENSYRKYGRGLPILNLKKNNLKNIILNQVCFKRGKFYTAGDYGHILTAVGLGKTVAVARQKSYSMVKKIIVPNAVYRTDIGDSWEWKYKKLKEWGYL